MNTWQKRFKELIESKECTISGVARSLDVSPASLHLWMNNKYKGNVDKITKAVKQFLDR